MRISALRPRAGALVSAVVLLLLAGRTVARNPVWASTESVITRLILEHPAGGRAQRALGSLHEANGAQREANAAYREAMGSLNADYALQVDVGRRLMNQGRYPAAKFLLEEALAKAPRSATAAEVLAVLHSRGDDPSEAARWARLATTLNPANVVSWHILATSLEAEGRVLPAVRAREEVIRRGEGERWQQWLSLARLLAAVGDSARSSAALDTARLRAGPPARGHPRQPLPAAVAGGSPGPRWLLTSG